MRRCIRVKGDIAGARLSKVPDQLINRAHHQVHIDIGGDAILAQGGTNHRSDREIRHIVIIHDIEMYNIGSCIEHRVDLFS